MLTTQETCRKINVEKRFLHLCCNRQRQSKQSIVQYLQILRSKVTATQVIGSLLWW